MVTNELLLRTIHAAKEARERGFYNTADAFDEIVENLLELLKSNSTIPGGEITALSSEFDHIH